MRKHSLPRVIEETDKFYLLGFVTYCECYDDIRILYSYDDLITVPNTLIAEPICNSVILSKSVNLSSSFFTAS